MIISIDSLALCSLCRGEFGVGFQAAFADVNTFVFFLRGDADARGLAGFLVSPLRCRVSGRRTKTVSKSGFSFDRLNLQLAFLNWLRYQSAMGNDSFENLAKKLAESLHAFGYKPEGLRSVRDDLESGFRSILQTGISKLDLVTREEFEVQEAVLAHTREKLESLEAKLEEIENAK